MNSGVVHCMCYQPMIGGITYIIFMHNILRIHDIHVNQYYGCEAFVICLKLIEILKDALLCHGVDWFSPIWAASWQNQQKWHVRPANTQISLGIRPVWSESSLSAWRKLGSLATHWALSEDSDQTGVDAHRNFYNIKIKQYTRHP